MDSSFDLWIDGYKKLLPGRKVSIYVKGAIIALLLDLTIRLSHKNTLSLDDLIRDLWSGYGKVEKGYRKEDVYRLIEKYIGQEAGSFIEKFYKGIIPVEDTLCETLSSFGCDLFKINHPERSADYYGFRIERRNNNYVVNEIAPNSIAESCLSIGDQLVSVNDEPVSDTVLNSLTEECELLIKRNNKEKAVSLKAGAERYYSIYEIRKTKNPDNFQLANFNSWLFDK